MQQGRHIAPQRRPTLSLPLVSPPPRPHLGFHRLCYIATTAPLRETKRIQPSAHSQEQQPDERGGREAKKVDTYAP